MKQGEETVGEVCGGGEEGGAVGVEDRQPGTNVKGCLMVQRGEGGKECNIGLRREEMPRGGLGRDSQHNSGDS